MAIQASNDRVLAVLKIAGEDGRKVKASGRSRWVLGGCPRCRGDIFVEGAGLVRYGFCLQCGYGGRVEAPVTDK